MSRNDPEDPQMWGLYVLPETRKEEKHLEGREVPCNQSKLSQWIMEWLGYQQTLAQPSVAAVNKDKAESYWKKNAGASSGYVLSCSSGAAFQPQNKF